MRALLWSSESRSLLDSLPPWRNTSNPMDGRQFDRITAILVTAANRRRTLGVLVGAVVGFLMGAGTEAATSNTCKPACNECQFCQKGTCRKKHGKKTCRSGKCKPYPSGHHCNSPHGGICRSGTCGCSGELTNCAGTCRNLKTDHANCGTCSHACPAGRTCVNGTCFPISICPGTTTSGCTPSTLCGGTCVCARAAEGNVLCLQYEDPCVAPLCTTSANCAPGEACVDVSGCCVPGLPAGSKICASPCIAPTA